VLEVSRLPTQWTVGGSPAMPAALTRKNATDQRQLPGVFLPEAA
jgi:hypothetical protein